MASIELKLLLSKICEVGTDRRTDYGEMIPKCHHCLQQVTQKLANHFLKYSYIRQGVRLMFFFWFSFSRCDTDTNMDMQAEGLTDRQVSHKQRILLHIYKGEDLIIWPSS